MTRRYRRGHTALVILALTPVLLALDVLAWLALAAWHLLPLLLGPGCVWLAYRAGRRRLVRPPRPPKVIQGRADDGEVIRLRAEVEALRAERDEARESARAGWDASTGPARPGTGRDRLLSDRLSQVHPLFPGGDQ